MNTMVSTNSNHQLAVANDLNNVHLRCPTDPLEALHLEFAVSLLEHHQEPVWFPFRQHDQPPCLVCAWRRPWRATHLPSHPSSHNVRCTAKVHRHQATSRTASPPHGLPKRPRPHIPAALTLLRRFLSRVGAAHDGRRDDAAAATTTATFKSSKSRDPLPVEWRPRCDPWVHTTATKRLACVRTWRDVIKVTRY